MRKSIAIIGEGETEWFYFDSMRVACRYPFRLAPDFPAHSDIDHLLKLSKAKRNEGYDYVVCLLDMDRLNSVPAEMKKYKTFKNKKENKDIMAQVKTSVAPPVETCYPKDGADTIVSHKIVLPL